MTDNLATYANKTVCFFLILLYGQKLLSLGAIVTLASFLFARKCRLTRAFIGDLGNDLVILGKFKLSWTSKGLIRRLAPDKKK